MAAACPFAGAICARAGKTRLLYPLPVISINLNIFLILSTRLGMPQPGSVQGQAG